ncbi:MAG: sulfatase, partial [Planctomycetes bacterium]|nr:sulfatase [Planctomycetota bacterium]
DSMDSYGAKVPKVTPNMDSLAEAGMRFQHAYIQTPSCCPSRNVFQTGQHPHNSGMIGFFSVDYPQDTLPEALRKNGYFTGIVEKVIDSTPTNNTSKYWDYDDSFTKSTARTPETYRKSFVELLKQAEKSGKPFYAAVNVKDPHLPFFRGKLTKKGFDKSPPSKIYKAKEVSVPGMLPDSKMFLQEVADYYSTLRRGDDTVGEVLSTLEQRGHRKNTIIVFISDHGMAFPFSKSNLYDQGVRTPWIVVWPGVVPAGAIDKKHMISAVDFMPTILEITKTPAPGPLGGKSILPLLKGEVQTERDAVFVQHNEGPTAMPRTMRAVHTKDYIYIFNAWGTGKHQSIFECRHYRSYKTFGKLAKDDAKIRKRKEFLDYRVVEELYDAKNDPFALNNLIEDPDYKNEAIALREKLEKWMEKTNDFALDGFLVRDDPAKLDKFLKKLTVIAQERTLRLEWKRNVKNKKRPIGILTELGPSNIVQ